MFTTTYVPASFVRVDCWTLVATLRRTTWAPGTSAPEVSRTVPLIEAVATCALRRTGENNSEKSKIRTDNLHRRVTDNRHCLRGISAPPRDTVPRPGNTKGPNWESASHPFEPAKERNDGCSIPRGSKRCQ